LVKVFLKNYIPLLKIAIYENETVQFPQNVVILRIQKGKLKI
jgi:hypothetical protein